MKKPIILYIHINKCGGTTLQNIFHKNFSSYISIYPIKNKQNILTQSHFDKLINMYAFQGLGGHNLYPHIDYQSARPIIYVVLFREPIARYMSQLNFRITRGVTRDIDHFLEADRYINQQFNRVALNGNLEQAKCFLLKENVFVGILEEFDLSMAMLKQFLQKWSIEMDIDYVISNITNKKYRKRYNYQDLNNQYQKQIARNNDKDIALYSIVKDLFEVQKTYYADQDIQLPLLLEEEHLQDKYRRKIKQFLVKKIVQPRLVL